MNGYENGDLKSLVGNEEIVKFVFVELMWMV